MWTSWFRNSAHQYLSLGSESLSPTGLPQDTTGSDSGLVLALGGFAGATGDNTLANGDINATVKDQGLVTTAIGSSVFTAAGSSQPGELATADAETFASVAGADFVYIITLESGPSSATGGTASSTSKTKVIALDWAFWDPDQPLVFNLTVGTGGSGNAYALQGNSAAITADAISVGQHTFTDTDTFALTSALDPHNSFSFVSGLAISGIA